MLLGVLTGFLLAIGFFLGGIFGMTLALVLSFGLNILSYWYSDRIVLSIYKAKPLEDKGINSIVEELAKNAGIPKPRIYKISNPVPNAFATGRDPSHAAVALTEGLLRLERDEIKGVIAHEMGHIKNRDILVSTIAATIAGAISYLAHIGYFMMFSRDSKDSGSMIGIIFIVIFAPLAALLIRLAISRAREFGADETGARIAGDTKGLKDALIKIHNISLHPQAKMKGPEATSHMWIVNPFGNNSFVRLFSTHPPMEERIKRLDGMKV